MGFYKDNDDLGARQIVVCSLESLHHLNTQRFDAILIDEIRSIARLVGGGTMKEGFNNTLLLGELCAKAARIVVCDADLTFTVNDSEPTSLAHDFVQLIVPHRPVLHASLTHPGPGHLRRGARVLHDHGCKKSNVGKRRWFQELEVAARLWHEDHSKRFAVCVGSKGQLEDVCEALVGLKVPFKPYSGDTKEQAKYEDLCDAGSAWTSALLLHRRHT